MLIRCHAPGSLDLASLNSLLVPRFPSRASGQRAGSRQQAGCAPRPDQTPGPSTMGRSRGTWRRRAPVPHSDGLRADAASVCWIRPRDPPGAPDLAPAPSHSGQPLVLSRSARVVGAMERGGRRRAAEAGALESVAPGHDPGAPHPSPLTGPWPRVCVPCAPWVVSAISVWSPADASSALAAPGPNAWQDSSWACWADDPPGGHARHAAGHAERPGSWRPSSSRAAFRRGGQS